MFGIGQIEFVPGDANNNYLYQTARSSKPLLYGKECLDRDRTDDAAIFRLKDRDPNSSTRTATVYPGHRPLVGLPSVAAHN